MINSPIIFYYFNLTGTQSYCRLVEDSFHKTGRTRPIEFRSWNCYSVIPKNDGDLYAFDGVVLSALVEKGLLRPVPDSVYPEDVFPWIMEKSLVGGKAYGLPFMLCSNALICRKKDDLDIRNIMELHENVAIPLRSMVMYYYIQAMCSNRDPLRRLKVMEHLLDLIGGRAFLSESSLADYDGINRFNREECRYFLGFTESIRYFKPDDYVIRFVNFSESSSDNKSLFMADFVSLGIQVPDEKLSDCLALMQIMAGEQFVYDACMLDGQLQYFLPANRCVFPRLTEQAPLYDHLYCLLNHKENGLLRYGKRYYKDFNRQEDVLLQFLWEISGWKSGKV